MPLMEMKVGALKYKAPITLAELQWPRFDVEF